jgi:SAM-dependent methyltransferase/uncharacterized protein YbaR (Trm112 family)
VESQSIDSLKGEVEFRKKLARQHVTGETLLPDYYDKEEHDKILLERMQTTARDIAEIARDVTLSPFIELGAERCQRSLVLTNDFKAAGFSVDISFDQLRTAAHFAEKFKKPALPYRVCCDVNHLPFRSDSFPFAFCYEFLHHFPTPKPIVREIHRVIHGKFLFREEPFKRPKLILFHQKEKLYSNATLRKSKVRRFFESFVSEERCDEREHGIIENDDIPLREWMDSVAVFKSREIVAHSLGGRINTALGNRLTIRNLPNLLLGGGIGGLCTKNSTPARPAVRNLTEFLLCPDCAPGTMDQPALVEKSGSLECQLCRSSFPIVDGVTVLLPTRLRRELYPELG